MYAKIIILLFNQLLQEYYPFVGVVVVYEAEVCQ